MRQRRVLIAAVLLGILVAAGCGEVAPPTLPTRHETGQVWSAAAANSEGDYVLTPFGWLPAAQVSEIPGGHSLRVETGQLQEMDAAGSLIRDLGSFETRTSNVPLFPANLAAGAPGGSLTPAILGSGWIAYSYWDRPSGQAIRADTTKWVVPPAPSTIDGQTILLFNGVQSASWTLQPVLQFGATRAGGGNYWSVACWYADGGDNAHYTSLHQVYPGDTIVGVVDSGSAGSGVSYYCAAHAPTFDIELDLAGSVPELYEAVETLEAYNLVACSDYPDVDSTAFKSISIRTHSGLPTLNWTAVNRVTDCGQHAHVVSNADPGGEVDLFYRNPPPPPLSATISGPSIITTKGTYTWTASPSGGTPPYSYQWAVRYVGGSRYSEGTQPSQSLTVYSGGSDFWMIVAVTGGGSVTDSMYVTNCIGVPGGCYQNAPVVAAGH